MTVEFEFERPISELERRLAELRSISETGNIDLSREINAIAEKIDLMKNEVFKNLEPWQVTQVARNIARPSTFDYIHRLCADSFVELHGDRLYGDDTSLVCGFGSIDGRSMAIIGHQKGHDTEQNLYRNFGMPHPEGYRKALRIMKMAQKFNKPVVIFVDTPGAFPGIGAEERGQSEAIARNLREMSQISVSIVCIVIGEGGSGGALAIGVGNEVFMLEFAVYSVISAEGCAAILWKDAGKSKEAASALKLRAQDLLAAGVVDGIIPEPLGGAHRDYDTAAANIRKAIIESLDRLSRLSITELIEQRYRKFRSIGKFKSEEEREDA